MPDLGLQAGPGGDLEGAFEGGLLGVVGQVCRLVGGVAVVADNADLEPDAVRPLLEVVADGLVRG